MGKGGGCVVSKNKISKSSNSTKKSPMFLLNQTLKSSLCFYSMYGHVASLLKRMKKGVDSVDGVEGALFDSTGLYGRSSGLPENLLDFVSTGSQEVDKETTAWTAITQLAHHGMLFVPIGYTLGRHVRHGLRPRSSPYGARSLLEMVRKKLLKQSWLWQNIRENIWLELSRTWFMVDEEKFLLIN
ncbi:hypothetical protein HAX54_050572 [Datura stramonium]|uniref:Uncharacterized protein n=1 Tax=Datura stramonium TaxID=4076 RepID=A0ABS8SWK9_DATST|nr:hypothetical protein [Datura stramonium]